MTVKEKNHKAKKSPHYHREFHSIRITKPNHHPSKSRLEIFVDREKNPWFWRLWAGYMLLVSFEKKKACEKISTRVVVVVCPPSPPPNPKSVCLTEGRSSNPKSSRLSWRTIISTLHFSSSFHVLVEGRLDCTSRCNSPSRAHGSHRIFYFLALANLLSFLWYGEKENERKSIHQFSTVNRF